MRSLLPLGICGAARRSTSSRSGGGRRAGATTGGSGERKRRVLQVVVPDVPAGVGAEEATAGLAGGAAGGQVGCRLALEDGASLAQLAPAVVRVALVTLVAAAEPGDGGTVGTPSDRDGARLVG